MDSVEPDLAEWNPFHVSNWPKSIAEPQAYDGGKRLSLGWDLGRVPEAQKKPLVRQWVARLPELQGLRWLNLWSHVTQPLFDAACRVRGLECLQIKWSNVRQLDEVAGLGALRYLHVGSSTRVESLQPLAALSGLKALDIENFKLITDFSPLLALTGLESLAVTGSMWTRQDVGTLSTFARMTWLKSLSLDTAHVKSLKPLAALTSLRQLGLGGKLPMQEYAWLAGRLPDTRCKWFKPWLDLAGVGFNPCSVCGKDSKVMLTGKGTRLLCRHCDQATLQRHADAFETVRRAAAAG